MVNIIEVDVVCPIYNGSKYINYLIDGLRKQSGVNINKIVFAITKGNCEDDNMSIELCKKYNTSYFLIDKKDFSHSLTRERAIKEFCNKSIVVMISQDIRFVDCNVLYNLALPILKKECAYSFARQICMNNSIEKYIREKNYPANSYFVEKKDIEEMQIMAFFSSDACSAYDRDIFIKIGGYRNYDVMMNEDQLYSYFVLHEGYKKKYCADAAVIHSHNYTLKQLYTRYYETGKFYSNVKIFDEYKSTDSGMKLALYILKRAITKFNVPVLLRWLPDMTARYLGMRKGKKKR